jgi:predicted permease
MALQGKRYETTAATSSFFKRGIERLQQHPSVESAAVVTNLPMERGLNLVTWIPGTDRADDPKLTDWRYVSTDYFRVLRIATIAGRVFTGADHAASEPVAVINQEFARRYFGKQDPIGRSMQIMRQSPEPDRTRVIVGVVADVKSENFRRPAPPTVFIPLDQAPDAHMAIANAFFQASWVVRTRDSAGNIAAVMQRELKAVDPLQPFSGFRTLDEVRARAVRSDRSMMLLLGSFAALAIALAAAGIFGVIAYSVAQRTREIGIRMALGATAGVVVRSIVTSGAVLAAIGILAGIAGALALTRFAAAYVFGVQPADPLTFATASLLVLAVAFAASLIPALRVTRLDPSRALRVD